MTRPIFRLPMAGDVSAYKTYTVARPEATHWRSATCAEVECEAWAKGWVTRVPVDSPQAHYIAGGGSGRAFVESTALGSAEREFMFKPGQKCFGTHRLPLEREPLYVVRDGDFRGNPTGRRMHHSSAQAWVDDFGEHQERLKQLQQEG